MVLTLKKFSNIGCQAGENIPKYPILDNLHSSRHFQIHIEFPILPFTVQKNILFNIRFELVLNKPTCIWNFYYDTPKRLLLFLPSQYSMFILLSCIFLVSFLNLSCKLCLICLKGLNIDFFSYTLMIVIHHSPKHK